MPADFLVTFARAMVDAGADMFVGHGPHVLRGIEIYKGKPILYSLGDFIFQNETLRAAARARTTRPRPRRRLRTSTTSTIARYNFDKSGFPADRLIWEAVVAVPRFRGERLTELALHPITLGFGKARSVRGRPQLAEGELGQQDSRRSHEAVGRHGHEDRREERRWLRGAAGGRLAGTGVRSQESGIRKVPDAVPDP